jgi:hypothetical protein
METPVPDFEKFGKVRTKVYCYLQALYENYDKVFWQRVPYAMYLRGFLNEVKIDLFQN